MFNRTLYKQRAREQLKGRWGLPIALTAISCALIALTALPLCNRASLEVNWHTTAINASTADVPLVFTLVAVAISGILATATAFVHLRLLRTESRVTFSVFLRGMENWLHGALGGLWYALWVSLWSLLFVIPGIVKAVAYSQLFFVLAENPALSPAKAMNISKILTQGHKMDLFVQTLSFIGWMLLCNLTCGIGYLWLIPYMTQTCANSYLALKNEALSTGRLCPADFAA